MRRKEKKGLRMHTICIIHMKYISNTSKDRYVLHK